MINWNKINFKWLSGQGLAAEPSLLGRTRKEDTSQHPRLLLFGNKSSRNVPSILLPASHQMLEKDSKNWLSFVNAKVRLFEIIVRHLTNYSSKFKYYTEPILEKLFRADIKARINGPSIEDLSIDTEFTKDPEAPPFLGRRKVPQKHRKLGMPFKLLPNCSKFSLKSFALDWLAGLFGLPMKIKTNDVTIRNWKNGGANKYLFSVFHQMMIQRDVTRLDFITDEQRDAAARRFFKLGFKMMESRPYILSALQHVFPNWSQDMSYKYVWKILEEVNHLVETKATKISYKRVYIPKKLNPDGTIPVDSEGRWTSIRPLGVPSPAWRIYLHMINNIVVWYRSGKEGDQHAYLPKKGVSTAWAEIMKNLDKKYIFEFDLKSFFDEVDLQTLSNTMNKELHYPKDFCNFIHRMNQSLIDLQFCKNIDDKYSLMFEKEPEHQIRYTPELKVNPNLPEKYQPQRVKGWSDDKGDNFQPLDTGFKMNPNLPEAPKSKELKVKINKDRELNVTAPITSIEPKDIPNFDKLMNGLTKGEILQVTRVTSRDYDSKGTYLGKRIEWKTKTMSIKSSKCFHTKNTDIIGLNRSMNFAQVQGLDEFLDSDWDQTLQQFLELERDIPNLVKTKGVPQGAPTSCGLSTILLDKLTRQEFYRHSNLSDKIYVNGKKLKDMIKIVMYADDGIIFTDDKVFVQEFREYLKKIKIEISEEKSGYVKEDGKWLKDLKFCGLKYLHGSKEMVASTRRGSDMRFTEEDQFLAYLLKRRNDIIYGGSASHLNERIDRYKGQSPKEWINHELEDFLTHENRASLLFEPTSGPILSFMFGKTYNLTVPTEKKLLFKKKSWVSLRWYKYQQKMLRLHGFELLQSELNIALKDLNLVIPYRVKTEEDLVKVKVWLENLGAFKKMMYGVKCQHHKLNRALDLINLCLKTKPTKNWRWHKEDNLTKDELIIIGSLLSINNQNCSSYAINDLLTCPQYNPGKIQFVVEGYKDLKPTEYPRNTSRLKLALRKIKREFKRQFEVPIIRSPFKINVKNEIYTKLDNKTGQPIEYFDKRGYYLRRLPNGKRMYTMKNQRTNWVVALFDILWWIQKSIQWACYWICWIVILHYTFLSWFDESAFERKKRIIKYLEFWQSDTTRPPPVDEYQLRFGWNWLWDGDFSLWSDYKPEPLMRACEECGHLRIDFQLIMLIILSLGIIMLFLNWSDLVKYSKGAIERADEKNNALVVIKTDIYDRWEKFWSCTNKSSTVQSVSTQTEKLSLVKTLADPSRNMGDVRSSPEVETKV